MVSLPNYPCKILLLIVNVLLYYIKYLCMYIMVAKMQSYRFELYLPSVCFVYHQWIIDGAPPNKWIDFPYCFGMYLGSLIALGLLST